MILSLEEIKFLVEPVFKCHNMKSAYVFGSYARGEATNNSDVDILIDYGENIISLFELAALKRKLHAILKKDVDLITTGSLKQSGVFSKVVNREKVKIFERGC